MRVEGLAFVCAPDGSVRELVAAELEGAQLGATLGESVDESSQEAARLFLRGVVRGGFARSTPLRIWTRDAHCFGMRDGDALRIVAVIDPASAAAFAETKPGFEPLAQEIRRTLSTYELYEELALVNNDLVTAQRELARTVAELQRLNGYKDELLGMAAHDLRSPLTANAGFIRFLQEDSEGLPENTRTLLAHLRTNSEYMQRLVESVLDFAAIQSGHVRLQLESCALEEIVRSVVETMRILAGGRGITIHLQTEAELPRMQLDPIKIQQAVQNLVANAVQYTPNGGEVDVRLGRVVENGVRTGVEIEVEDRGPGIPPHELPELFKPFTRVSTVKLSKHRSVGLGLAITRRLIEAHGGTIDVRSEVGRGSTFRILLRVSA
ncbi:MAG TPA: HAMP domain-containing sensor histidine kinase [Thermoanaerobaculia bacterium]